MGYIGKLILIGVTLISADGQVVGRKQVAGTIRELSEDRIIVSQLETEEEFGLPPDLEAIQIAARGVYQLQNGNVDTVENPDFITTYNLYLKDDEVFPDGYK